MPDIAMCNSTECPSRGECYRHEATPSEYQYYADFDAGRGDADKCGEFWPVEGEE